MEDSLRGLAPSSRRHRPGIPDIARVSCSRVCRLGASWEGGLDRIGAPRLWMIELCWLRGVSPPSVPVKPFLSERPTGESPTARPSSASAAGGRQPAVSDPGGSGLTKGRTACSHSSKRGAFCTGTTTNSSSQNFCRDQPHQRNCAWMCRTLRFHLDLFPLYRPIVQGPSRSAQVKSRSSISLDPPVSMVGPYGHTTKSGVHGGFELFPLACAPLFAANSHTHTLLPAIVFGQIPEYLQTVRAQLHPHRLPSVPARSTQATSA